MAFSAGVLAQESGRKFNDNNWVIGGTASYSHDKDKIAGTLANETTRFRIEPFVGYQISDRWRAGITFGYTNCHIKTPALDLGNSVNYKVGPYVHFDILKWKRWTLFAEAEFFYIWSPESVPMDGDPITGEMVPAAGIAANPFTVKVNAFSFTVKPGLSFALDKCLNIDFNLNLLGWYFAYNEMEVVKGTAATPAGQEMTSSHHGMVLDLLESTPADYWEKISIGLTFKF